MMGLTAVLAGAGRCLSGRRRGRLRERCPGARSRLEPGGLISGGDALVSARVADPATTRVDVDGADVTSAFAVRPNGRYEGLVTGLQARGQHARRCAPPTGAASGSRSPNHPIGGPVFAGPQVTPYTCNPNASNPPLGPALDAQCNAPTRVELLYRNAANQFVAYDRANPPADVPTTTTDAGRACRSSSSA